MAINNMDILTGADQVKKNHEKYAEKFKDANADLVNSETFLSLLVAEMTNQDPLEPTSNTEFITQMAQFSQLQYLQDASSYSMGNYASSLVGKTVTVSEMVGGEKVEKTGVVSEVKKVGDEFQIVVDGVQFKLKSIQSIAETGTNTAGGEVAADNSLGELIAKASSMIGMYAEVKPASNGGLVVYDGFIESVKVKDGKVNVVINNVAYDLNDIVEVYYATVVPNEPTTPDDGANADNGDEAIDTDNTIDTDNATGDGADMELDAETAAAAGAGANEEMLHEVGRIEPEDEGEDLADLNTEGIV